MGSLSPRQLQFLIELHDLIDQAGAQYGRSAARRLQEQFERLAGRLLDSDGPGTTLLFRRTGDGQGFIRLSSFPDDGAYLRVSINTGIQPSVDYSWIKEELVRSRLVADNMIMEHAVITSVNEAHSERHRFIQFCLAAHLQLELLLFYYFDRSGYQPKAQDSKYPNHSSRVWEFFKIFPRSQIKASPDWSNRHCRNVEALRVLRNIESHPSAKPTSYRDQRAKATFDEWPIEKDMFDMIRGTVQYVAYCIKDDFGL